MSIIIFLISWLLTGFVSWYLLLKLLFKVDSSIDIESENIFILLFLFLNLVFGYFQIPVVIFFYGCFFCNTYIKTYNLEKKLQQILTKIFK